MATYEVEITKKLMKTVTITVPDNIPAEDVEEWAGENASEVFDVDSYQGIVEWEVEDLVEDEEIKMQLAEKFEDFEYEIEGFDPKI